MTNKTDIPLWRSLIEAAFERAENKNTASYLQLATHDEADGVQLRTMVWRGFSQRGSGLLMATDLRSAKIEQINRDPRAQLVWYLSDAREQFRCSGALTCIRPGSADQTSRQAVWQSMSLRARQSFFATSFATNLGAAGASTSGVNATKVVPQSLEFADYFAVLRLDISEVDHLSVATEPNRRVRYRLHEGHWISEPIDL